MSHNHILIVLVLSLFSVGEMFAQSPITEKRIYLVDLTGSMEGRGSVPTPNILQTVKDNLEETISNIEDTATKYRLSLLQIRLEKILSAAVLVRRNPFSLPFGLYILCPVIRILQMHGVMAFLF